jgi:hypothetical protein
MVLPIREFVCPKLLTNLRKAHRRAVASTTAMTGAQYEIRIDGAPRTYRDRKEYAMEAARLIKSKNPHSLIEVRDLRSGDVTAVALRPG